MVPNELVDRGDSPRVVGVTAPDGYGKGSIITPEAVVLDFELAGLGSRAIAYAVDFAVQFIALIGLALLTSGVAISSDVVAIVVLLVFLIVIVLGYPTLMETFNGGRTLGRMLVRTRVVTVEGAPVRFRHGFIRSLLGILEQLATAGALAVAVSLVTRRGQRLGDLVAGTMIIREPKTTGPIGAVQFWPATYLAEWSQTVDTTALGNDDYQLVRDFLTSAELTPDARVELGDELAAVVSARLPHAARTAAVPSNDYLTAIAVAMQGPGGPLMPPPPSPTAAFLGQPVPPVGRSPIQPPPPGVGAPARPSPLVPPPPVTRPVAPPPPVVQSPTPVAQPPAPATPAGPVEPAPPAPNDGGFAAPG